MPFGLTQAPAHFHYVVENVIHDPSLPQLPCTIYLDDIAAFGDDPVQKLSDAVEAIIRLARAGFMVNLTKSHIAERLLKILGHKCSSGGYWMPERERLE